MIGPSKQALIVMLVRTGVLRRGFRRSNGAERLCSHGKHPRSEKAQMAGVSALVSLELVVPRMDRDRVDLKPVVHGSM